MSDADGPLTWEEANLPLDCAAALLAVGDGLAAIGKLRSGRRAGQLSIFNFRVRAASEGGDSAEDRLVLLMRSGIMRRHTFFCRFTPPAAVQSGRASTLALSGPIDRGWDWWPPFEELRDRLIDTPAWRNAVGESYDERLARFRSQLAGADLRPMRESERQR